MLDAAGETGGLPRAFLKIGAGTLAHKQLAVALACECSKIICISRSLTPELVALQHDVERAGARFHCISGARALSSLITAVDEVVVISDGLLSPQQDALELLTRGQGVVVQPVEVGLVAGFERIDADHAAAGLMRIPGRLVEQLSMLPDDCDIASALTRIALQAGIAQRKLVIEAGGPTKLKILRNQADADAAEAEWFGLQLRGGSLLSQGPAKWLAQQAVRLAGPSLLHGRNGSNTFALACVAIVLLALALGWFGLVAGSLIGAAVAAVAGLSSGILRNIELESLSIVPGKRQLQDVFPWLVDATLVAVLTWCMPPYFAEPAWHRAFAPVMLVVTLRLVSAKMELSLSRWLGDHVVLCSALIMAASLGWLNQAVFAFTAGLGLFGLLWPRKLN